MVEEGTENPIGVMSGTTPQGLMFTNIFNDVASVADSLRHQLGERLLDHHGEAQGGGEPILDETIQGKKSGVVEVDTEPQESTMKS